MNKENAKEYLPLVQALRGGKTLQQQRWKDSKWEDLSEVVFSSEAKYYRIKPEQWYRVAEFEHGLGVATSANIEKSLEDDTDFVRWLTPRIDY